MKTEDVDYGGQVNMIVCNRCGKTIKMKNDIAYEDFIRVCKPWGYFSKKSDAVLLTNFVTASAMTMPSLISEESSVADWK